VAAPTPFGLHHARGHRGVVEDAEARTLVGIGMVGAARQVGRQAAARQGSAAGLQRGTDRAQRALGHGRRPGKTDLALLRRRQRALGDGSDIGRVVHQRQLAGAGRQGRGQAPLGQLLLEALTQQRVLGHGKTMSIGQGQYELIRIKGLHHDILAQTRQPDAGLGQPPARSRPCKAGASPYNRFHAALQQSRFQIPKLNPTGDKTC
jgi:hypothetical protein